MRTGPADENVAAPEIRTWPEGLAARPANIHWSNRTIMINPPTGGSGSFLFLNPYCVFMSVRAEFGLGVGGKSFLF